MNGRPPGCAGEPPIHLGSRYYVTVTVPTNLVNVIAVGGGNSHSVALKADGTLAVWGYNHSGGETNVPAGLSNIVSIAVAHNHSLALRDNGTVAAWG